MSRKSMFCHNDLFILITFEKLVFRVGTKIGNIVLTKFSKFKVTLTLCQIPIVAG